MGFTHFQNVHYSLIQKSSFQRLATITSHSALNLARSWSGYDELDTRLRAKGVQDGPKKKAIRQAVQGLGGKGGPARGNDGQRPIGGTRHKGFDAEKMGDDAFPGNGSPKINKDYGIVKLKKKAEELERENETLKNFRAFLSRGHARGSSSSKSIGARSAPSRRHAG